MSPSEFWDLTSHDWHAYIDAHTDPVIKENNNIIELLRANKRDGTTLKKSNDNTPESTGIMQMIRGS